MDTSTRLGLRIGAAILAAAALVGVAGCAAATTAAPDSSLPAGANGGGGPGGGQGMVDTSQLAALLATKLGVDQDKVATALKEVMEASQPSGAPSGQPSGQPTGQPGGQPTGQPGGQPSGTPGGGGGGGGNSEYLTTLAKGLAEKLDLKEATVLTAVTEAMQSLRSSAQPSSSAS